MGGGGGGGREEKRGRETTRWHEARTTRPDTAATRRAVNAKKGQAKGKVASRSRWHGSSLVRNWSGCGGRGGKHPTNPPPPPYLNKFIEKKRGESNNQLTSNLIPFATDSKNENLVLQHIVNGRSGVRVCENVIYAARHRVNNGSGGGNEGGGFNSPSVSVSAKFTKTTNRICSIVTHVTIDFSS
ncbi:unnamed protein product, partial [Iphiclides podalirius]